MRTKKTMWLAAAVMIVAAATVTFAAFFQSFETDTAGWTGATRVSTLSHGVPSKTVLQGSSLGGSPQELTLEGNVTGGSVDADGRATFSWSASLDMGDGTPPLASVPFSVTTGADDLVLLIESTELTVTRGPGAVTID
jgi:hypothetical protein